MNSSIQKIILFKGRVETLEYFSLQLERELKTAGYDVFVYDFQEESTCFPRLKIFLEDYHTAMISFNFTGLLGDDIFQKNTSSFWEQHHILCLNIMVDHPFYYYEHLKHLPENYRQICIDRDHLAYMKRFFPSVNKITFLPLAGNCIQEVLPDYDSFCKRPYGISFCGNYTPPEKFNQYIDRNGTEYADFYHGIIDDLISHPFITMEAAFETHLKREIPEITEQELLLCMSNMIFIDLYVRFYFRGKAVQTLAEAGIPIHVFGSGWELLSCKEIKNIINGGPLTSVQCQEIMNQSKLSLNVMPWFKDGAHDRIFNSMLAGAVSLTDSSLYLDSLFHDEQELAFYSLSDFSKLPIISQTLLSSNTKAFSIAKRGYQTAMHSHTWKVRSKQIIDFLIS